jgi:hypothetical protein
MSNDPVASHAAPHAPPVEPTSAAAPARSEAPQPTPQLENPEPFAFGTVVARAFALYGRNFLPLTALTLLLMLPWLVSNAASTTSAAAGQMTPATLVSLVLSMISVPLANAAAACAVAELVRGRPVRIGASLRAMWPHAIGVVAAAFLTSIGAAFAMIACIVPGLILMAMFYVTMPALLIERLNAIDACKRSMELTKGHRVAAFFLAIAPLVLNITVSASLTPALALPLTVSTGVTSLCGVLTGAFGAVLATIAYIDLRNQKEPGFKGQALDDALASLTQR